MSLSDLVKPLLDWYGAVKKPLPWRESPTPYHVWISEIMLQQTRIEAVIPYYRRFLAELPTVEDLANVPDDRLMKLWEGLGYYSRARNLKKAASVIVTEYHGELPRTADELRALPGIGDYTAGAIASIAFGEPEPAVDGNVLRVFSRVTALADDIMIDKTKKAVRERLREVYPTGTDAGRFTQALMELGETVCLPSRQCRPPIFGETSAEGESDPTTGRISGVKCADCPIRAYCTACRTGTTEQYPVKSGKKARRIEDRTVLLIRHGDRYLVQKRPAGGLLAEMWEFPNALRHLGREDVREAAESLGLTVRDIRPAGKAKHIFSHVEWHMIGYTVDVCGMTDGIWATAEEIRETYAIPTAFRYFVGQIE